MLSVNDVEFERGSTSRHVGAVGLESQLLEQSRVEPACYRIAVSVFKQSHCACRGICYLHRGASGISEPDRENAHAALCGIVGRVARIGLVVFTVGDKDYRTRRVSDAFKAVNRLANRLFQSCTTATDAVGPSIVECQPDKPKVRCQWC